MPAGKRKMHRLAKKLAKAGWKVRPTSAAGYVCWPPDPAKPPVTLHCSQSCGYDDRNMWRRLAKSGWTEGPE